MAILREIQNTFGAGVIDPTFWMRTETNAYNQGLEEARNGQLLNGGGVMRRPGTRYLADITEEAKLHSFVFDSDEAYICAFSNLNCRIYDTDGTLQETLTTPYSLAESQELSVTQLADTMIVCHQDYMPRIITRTGLNTFTISTFAFDVDVIDEKTYQPYFKYADPTITLRLSATSGTGVTATASSAVFTSDWVGDIIKWFDTELEITGYTSTTQVTVTVRGTAEGEYLNNPFRTTETSGTVEVTHAFHGLPNSSNVTISGATSVGGITAAQLNGTHTITVVDDNRYTIATGGTATSSVDGGGPSVKFTGANIRTRRWSQPVFSVVNGYPRSCVFYESRLWLASTPVDPSALWSSKIGQYFNFDVGTALDNESIQATLGTNQQIAEIKHLSAERDLLIFTSTGEYYAPKNLDSTLTPGTFRIVKQTPYGVNNARPVNFDGATLFVQSGTNAVREFLYQDVQDAYAAASVSFLATHLISNPVQIAVLHGTATLPEQYAFFVNDDGTIAQFLSARAEKLNGWTWWDTYHPSGTANFVSACVVNRQLFVCVERDTDFFLERVEPDDTQTLDSAVNYTNGSPQTSWTVGAQFYDLVVDVMTGSGVYLGQYTVGSAGALELDYSVDDIWVGWGSTFTVTPVPPRVELPTGTRIGVKRRPGRNTVHFYNTYNCFVDGQPLLVRNVTDDLSEDPTAFEGKREFTKLGWGRDPTITFTQDAPQKCTILGIIYKVMVT